ncbi:MAG: hypothetical protein Q8S44_04520 [Flavobacteriaceae bacterium]|nr:hypothetical protein [Flavobacteriaceae bacterium]
MKKYFTLFLLLSGIYSAISQVLPITEIEKERNDILDDLFQEDSDIDELMALLSNYQLLYISTNYNNATYFSGRDIGIDQYNIRPQITYLNSSGLFASIYGIYYSKLEPKWDVTTATLGYGKSFGKNNLFKYYASYSKYFYNNTDVNIFSNDISVGLSIRDKKRTLGTQFTSSYLFGNEQSIQITSTSYAIINLLKTKKANLALRPQLSIIAGKQTIELAQSYTRMGQVFTTYTTNDVFNLINTQLNIPLQFSANSFDFELGYNINFPNAIGNESNLKNTSFFNLRMGYLFDL